MDKLEYDSLHKFLVSLGLIFIALPFVALYFFFSCDFTLISQEEYANLSAFSLNQISQHEILGKYIFVILPIASIILFALGIILLIIGIKNWKKVQRNIDAVLDANRIKQELDVAKLKNSEKIERTQEEINEAKESNNQGEIEISSIKKYMDIEDRYFANAFSNIFKRRYALQRDVRVGKYEYDGIAVSAMDSIDLIFEIKYWKRLMPAQILTQTIIRLYESGINYETLKNRNFRCVLSVVTEEKLINDMRSRVDRVLSECKNVDLSKIEVQYTSEETI